MEPGSAVRYDPILDYVPRRLLVGGCWIDAADGATFAVEDPASGAALGSVADAGPADARAALDAATAAQDGWARTAPRARADILRRACDELLERSEELAVLMTLEMGKPLAEARGEVAYAADFLRWFSEEAERVAGRFASAPDGHARLLTMRQPVGPCLLITPWNFPLAMGARKIGPAVAAGCTMVVKPAPQTPLSMLALADVLERAGLPPGVLNIVPTTRAAAAVEPLLDDRRLRKLSFTGSTAVGRALAARSGGGPLRVSLELGGNAPFLVFKDADLDAAVEGALLAKLRNGGQACTAANRFLFHRSVAAELAERLAVRVGALAVGHGLEPATQLGPLIDHTQRERVAELVDDAVARGATAVAGGARIDGPGHFYPGTVLADVPPGSRMLHEEIFGPVAPIAVFDDEDEAVARANDTEYGLVAYVYTRDLDRALRVSERLQTGMVGLNRGLVSNAAAPFGGVKASGIGREGGAEGIGEFLETKYVAVAA